MHSVLKWGVATILGLASVAANADIAYNNFGAGDTFNSGSNWSVDPSQYLAMPFTSAASGSVSLVTVALFSSANYTASLELDNNGLNPGTVLETWNFSGTGAAQALTGDGSASLTSGNSYWLEIDPQTANDSGAWYLNSTGASGTFLYTSGGVWNNFNGTLSVFRVETTPVPEPISLSVLGAGLIGVAFRRRRARRS